MHFVDRWQNDLGEKWKEIQAKYLHTIGNLTLTGHNSNLSDNPFIEKRDMKNGFADSPLYLNRILAKLDFWNEIEIKNRAEFLADIAIKVWVSPSHKIKNSIENINKPNQSSYNQYLQGKISELFEAIRKHILNLDASIKEEFKRHYIAYKTTTNFVDIVPQRNRLRLSLNMRFEEIDDPKGLCKDITNSQSWGNGDVELSFSSLIQLDDVMFLIRQAFNKYSDEL